MGRLGGQHPLFLFGPPSQQMENLGQRIAAQDDDFGPAATPSFIELTSSGRGVATTIEASEVRMMKNRILDGYKI
ncbi:Protein of unknown function [Pyronema omphalodes CBS 100304]|uniref:Uncharacterized protein n=1 Tax=Pyronema omphalodes (strain CBS 100304) TaxID=1076935 RepID=U4LSC9_PYROM|nr:Protein of unknown function [Pyronema omphalodes CBS 100304]